MKSIQQDLDRIHKVLEKVEQHIEHQDFAGAEPLLASVADHLARFLHAQESDFEFSRKDALKYAQICSDGRYAACLAAVRAKQGRFAESIEAARHAHGIQVDLWRAPDQESGNWHTSPGLFESLRLLLSCLIQAGRRDEAYDTALSFLKAREPWRKSYRDYGEPLFVTMLQELSSDPLQQKALFAQMQVLVPEPYTAALHYAYAAEHAGAPGSRTRARTHLVAALEMSPALREKLSGDAAFQTLLKDPELAETLFGEVDRTVFFAQFRDEESIAHPENEPDDFRAAFLAELLTQLSPGQAPVPGALKALAKKAADERVQLGEVAYWERVRKKGLCADALRHWEVLAGANQLSARGAEALARVLVACGGARETLLGCWHEAQTNELHDAETLLANALRQHHAAFFAEHPHLKIDRSFLPKDPVAAGEIGFYAEFFPSGHLEEAGFRFSLRSRGQIPPVAVLKLDETPGTGYFDYSPPKQNWSLVEHYRGDGRLHSRVGTEWNDNDDGTETSKPWPCWVAKCLQMLAAYVPPKMAATPTRKRAVAKPSSSAKRRAGPRSQ